MHFDLSSRKDFNKLIAGSEKLKHSAFLKKILCETELNFSQGLKIEQQIVFINVIRHLDREKLLKHLVDPFFLSNGVTYACDI